MGWGALLNQQTTHKGGAHTDPNGPHRVVFIITFAPRPRTGSLEVETRMIAKGGTYSLHWTQWGHTYADFARPEHFMKQPWRTLKSLGIYKSRGSDWGWDFLTQSVGRMANGEAGFSQEETDEFFGRAVSSSCRHVFNPMYHRIHLLHFARGSTLLRRPRLNVTSLQNSRTPY